MAGGESETFHSISSYMGNHIKENPFVGTGIMLRGTKKRHKFEPPPVQ